MLLDRRLNLLNIWRVCRELSAAFFWSHNSAANFHRMRCASCTRHGAALFPRKDRKRMAHRDVTAQFKLEKLGRKKKLASTTVQIIKLCHCLGGWNSPSRQRGAPRTGHQFIRGLTYGAQTHTYWHSDSPINPTCVSLDCRRRPCSEQSPGSFSSEAAGLTAAPAALPLW